MYQIRFRTWNAGVDKAAYGQQTILFFKDLSSATIAYIAIREAHRVDSLALYNEAGDRLEV